MRPVAARLRSAAAGLLLLLGAADAARAEKPMPVLAGVEETIYLAVNEYRESRGQNALRLDLEVAELARSHSAAMARGETAFGHNGFNARAGKLMKHLPVKAVAENIAKSTRTPAEVGERAVPNWITSDVHRNNIENRHQVTGVGAAMSEDGTIFVTQIFVRTQ